MIPILITNKIKYNKTPNQKILLKIKEWPILMNFLMNFN